MLRRCLALLLALAWGPLAWAAPGCVARTCTPEENTVTHCTSAESGPMISMPGSGISSLIC